MRHLEDHAQSKEEGFQSTHPVWDATRATLCVEPHFGISIHASRMGCDDIRYPTARYRAYFNPRIPYGMRLWPFSKRQHLT